MAPASFARSIAAATALAAVSDPSVPTTIELYMRRSYAPRSDAPAAGPATGEERRLPFPGVRGIWLWMQVVIVVCVLASAAIAVVKLYL